MTTLKNFFPTEAEIPEKFNIASPIEQREYLLNGKLVTWNGEVNEVFSPVCVLNPETNEIKRKYLGSFPSTGVPEAIACLDAAVQAYNHGRGEWPTMSIPERIACLEKFIKIMQTKREEVVRLLMWEIGKNLPDSEKEFDRTVDYIFDTLEAYKDLDRKSSRFEIEQGIMAQIRRAPLGVVLCMGPFNYPLNETFTMLIPALIMGNTMLFKPPKHGALLHYPLMDAFLESFPKGVINFVYGKGSTVVPELMKTGKIDVLTLIGSSKVADQLKKAHPKINRLRAILGLDAKNAAIVLPDADIDLAVKECVSGSLSFNGQRCTAIKIIWVHESLKEVFVKKFSEEVNKLKLGMPWETGVNITPLPEPGKPKYLKECIDDALAKGAQVMNDGGGTFSESMFFPAVIFPVKKDMKLYEEEQFGPIVPITTFNDIEEPIQYLIDSDHGQQASIFGTDEAEIAKLIDPLVNQVCRLNINCQCQRGPDKFPFTGRKDSAEGTLSVNDALRAYSLRTLVAAKQTDLNKKIFNDIVENGDSSFLSTRFVF